MNDYDLDQEAIRRHHKELSDEELAQLEPEDRWPTAMARKMDVSLIQKLQEFDRLVLLGVYWGNLSRRAVAMLTNSARDTILASLKRSQKALRDMIDTKEREG